MTRATITPEEAEVLRQLYEEHALATQQASQALRLHGMTSPQFFEADRRAGDAWRRIREILGDAGKHWMA